MKFSKFFLPTKWNIVVAVLLFFILSVSMTAILGTCYALKIPALTSESQTPPEYCIFSPSAELSLVWWILTLMLLPSSYFLSCIITIYYKNLKVKI